MLQSFGFARIGRDAELRFTPEGTAVANLSLAFNYGRKGDDGKRPTAWVDGSLWGKQAEALAHYLLKGTGVAITLEDVHIETFKGRDGTPGSKMVGRVTAIDFTGSAAQGEQRQQSAPAARPAAQPQRTQAANATTGFDNMDDDIPF